MLVDQRLEQESSAISEPAILIMPKQPTREELLAIIKEKERDIASLHEEIDKLEKYKAFDEGADATKAMYNSFVNAGFNEDQAFALTKLMINNTFKAGMINVR